MSEIIETPGIDAEDAPQKAEKAEQPKREDVTLSPEAWEAAPPPVIVDGAQYRVGYSTPRHHDRKVTTGEKAYGTRTPNGVRTVKAFGVPNGPNGKPRKSPGNQFGLSGARALDTELVRAILADPEAFEALLAFADNANGGE